MEEIMKEFFKGLKKQGVFLLMVLPGALSMLIFFYIPVFGNVVAFKDFRYSPNGFLASIVESKWVGFDNFKFLFSSSNAYIITRNTVLYNVAMIFIGLILSISLAIIMSMLRSKKRIKIFQTAMLFPHFLSWVIISYFVYSFLSPDKGLVNVIRNSMGLDPVNWYTTVKFWPGFLIGIGVWKGLGYNSVVYFAAVMGIDPTFYEAAIIDGANRWQQVKYVTIPQLIPLVSILMIMAIGNIFRADFGLFYQVPRNSGSLYNVTQVLDTFVFNGLAGGGDIGMASAAGLYQSVVGSILLISTNAIVRRLDPESALF